MTAAERREKLLAWMRAQEVGPYGMEGPWIAGSATSPPVLGHPMYCAWGKPGGDRCFDDLKALAREGKVERLPGRPAKWKVCG